MIFTSKYENMILSPSGAANDQLASPFANWEGPGPRINHGQKLFTSMRLITVQNFMSDNLKLTYMTYMRDMVPERTWKC